MPLKACCVSYSPHAPMHSCSLRTRFAQTRTALVASIGLLTEASQWPFYDIYRGNLVMTISRCAQRKPRNSLFTAYIEEASLIMHGGIIYRKIELWLFKDKKKN